MFDSLSDQLKHDGMQQSSREKITLWIVVTLVTIAVFAAVYFGVRMIG